MSDEQVVRHCSPTLAGLKTGNIFCCDFDSDGELTGTLCRLNRQLSPYGLRALPLRHTRGGGRAMIYIYRPSMLGQDIAAEGAKDILEAYGYCTGNANRCVARLMERLKTVSAESFPHEIGLFLGYPPEDVEGFINNHAGGCKICGAWKVYGDAESARKKFDSYKKCTASCLKEWKKSGSLEKLIADRGTVLA